MNFTLIPQDKLEYFENSLSEIKQLLHTKQSVQDPAKWISKPEACKILKVCSKTFDNYLKKGTIPFTQFKSKIYIKASDIESHLEKYYITKN